MIKKNKNKKKTKQRRMTLDIFFIKVTIYGLGKYRANLNYISQVKDFFK
jgi:hypothetical protein